MNEPLAPDGIRTFAEYYDQETATYGMNQKYDKVDMVFTELFFAFVLVAALVYWGVVFAFMVPLRGARKIFLDEEPSP